MLEWRMTMEIGVKQDKFKAVELFQKACEREDSEEYFGLGTMYEFGKGVK